MLPVVAASGVLRPLSTVLGLQFGSRSFFCIDLVLNNLLRGITYTVCVRTLVLGRLLLALGLGGVMD